MGMSKKSSMPRLFPFSLQISSSETVVRYMQARAARSMFSSAISAILISYRLTSHGSLLDQQ